MKTGAIARRDGGIAKAVAIAQKQKWLDAQVFQKERAALCADAKQRQIDNIVSSLGNGVPLRIQELQIQLFYKADPA